MGLFYGGIRVFKFRDSKRKYYFIKKWWYIVVGLISKKYCCYRFKCLWCLLFVGRLFCIINRRLFEKNDSIRDKNRVFLIKGFLCIRMWSKKLGGLGRKIIRSGDFCLKFRCDYCSFRWIKCVEFWYGIFL